jgi:hypothetical protein
MMTQATVNDTTYASWRHAMRIPVYDVIKSAVGPAAETARSVCKSSHNATAVSCSRGHFLFVICYNHAVYLVKLGQWTQITPKVTDIVGGNQIKEVTMKWEMHTELWWGKLFKHFHFGDLSDQNTLIYKKSSTSPLTTVSSTRVSQMKTVKLR